MFSNVFAGKMPKNPEIPNTLQYFSDNLLCQFEVTEKNAASFADGGNQEGIESRNRRYAD